MQPCATPKTCVRAPVSDDTLYDIPGVTPPIIGPDVLPQRRQE